MINFHNYPRDLQPMLGHSLLQDAAGPHPCVTVGQMLEHDHELGLALVDLPEGHPDLLPRLGAEDDLGHGLTVPLQVRRDVLDDDCRGCGCRHDDP